MTGRWFGATSTGLYQSATTAMSGGTHSVFKTLELAANLTRLDFVNAAGSGIDIGSKFRIYKRG